MKRKNRKYIIKFKNKDKSSIYIANNFSFKKNVTTIVLFILIFRCEKSRFPFQFVRNDALLARIAGLNSTGCLSMEAVPPEARNYVAARAWRGVINPYSLTDFVSEGGYRAGSRDAQRTFVLFNLMLRHKITLADD